MVWIFLLGLESLFGGAEVRLYFLDAGCRTRDEGCNVVLGVCREFEVSS
jgi:hypothetical protein